MGSWGEVMGLRSWVEVMGWGHGVGHGVEVMGWVMGLGSWGGGMHGL